MNDFNRREFLSTAGKSLAAGRLTPLAVTLASSLAAKARAQDAKAETGKKLGYAFVGLGRLTINELLPSIQRCKHSKCVALVSGDAEKAKKLAGQYGVSEKAIYNYQNYDTLADNPEVDIIYIVLPNGMHAEYTVRGFKAGKHVLCEKPMANTALECQQMIDAGKAAGKKLMIAYRVHYEPHHIRGVKMARDRELGAIKMIVADNGFRLGWSPKTPDETRPWRLDKELAGGGALYDVGVYGINACRFFTGEEPIEVSGMTHTPANEPRFSEVEESTTYHLKFPSGILANGSTSYSAGSNRYRMMCTDGWYELDPAINYRGIRMRSNKAEIEEPEIDQFAAEMDHFSQCVMENKESITPGEMGLNDLRVIEAIYKSAREGVTVKLTQAGGPPTIEAQP